MTRVLHLIEGLGPGGAEALLVAQAGVAVEGVESSIAYLVPAKDHHVAEIEASGWPVTCLDAARIWDPRWLVRFRRLLADVDVVHGHSPLVQSLARVVRRTVPRHRRPASVYTEHNEWGRHRRPTRLLNRLTLRSEDRVLAVSDAVRRSMRTKAPVEVVVHGIDLESVAAFAAERDAVRAELGLQDAVVVGIVANHRREKGYEVLVQAARDVTRRRPEVVYVAVGQGPLEQTHRDLAAEAGLGDRLRFLGYRADARRVMAGFDVVTLSSHHEGLPVTLMEASALGLPVVATSVGGVPEAVDPARSVLVEPGRPDELAAGHLAMIDQLGRGSLPPPTVDQRFDVRVTASILAGIHRTVAADVR
ncbi:MAG: glycosyltransferase [Actinomycetota bacterium]